VKSGPPRKPRPASPAKPRPVEPHIIISHEQTRDPRLRTMWIFDNMVAGVGGNPSDGDAVAVYEKSGKFAGSAVWNSQSRIRARMFSLDRVRWDMGYIRGAIEAAWRRRLTHYAPEDSFRVVFSDADFLPGLIVDKVGGVAVIQFQTLAVNRYRDPIAAAVGDITGCRAVVMRFDSPVRRHEGLATLPPVTEGEVPDPLFVEMDGVVVCADLAHGQKTGLFLDQRWNRRLITPLCEGRRVLDLFCHVGAWSFTAARAGAREVLGVDLSGPALALARLGAKRNGFGNVRFEEQDAFDHVTAASKAGEQYDLVVCDPPAFAKNRRTVPEALRGYLSLNYRAMKLLAPGGVLVTCSCSQHVGEDEFRGAVETAMRNARISLQLVARGGQPPDHPVLMGFPESEYLKCLVLRRC
jgi:23S rRNA (cytosine1962-C5)-methyltransferase